MTRSLKNVAARHARRSAPARARAITLLSLLLIGGLAGGGCVERRVVSSTWDTYEEMADPKPDADRPRSSSGRRGGFSIQLAEFTGPDRLKQAYDYSRQLRQQAQVPDVWFLDRGDTAVVYTGRFPRTNHPEAAARLKQVRGARIDGGRPFRNAQLIAVDESRTHGDPNDLSQYSGYRTLLLAVFDPAYPGDFRRAAEDYAAQLRQEHDFSFYHYHGVNQSMVTTGLYTLRDFVPVNGVDQYGPAIRERQAIFPLALRNGEKMPSPDVPGDEKFEPTIIVNVP
jgi:hypothetical protein